MLHIADGRRLEDLVAVSSPKQRNPLPPNLRTPRSPFSQRFDLFQPQRDRGPWMAGPGLAWTLHPAWHLDQGPDVQSRVNLKARRIVLSSNTQVLMRFPTKSILYKEK
jgi:hypothetical protein